MAARQGQPSDFRRAAAMIMAANPLGGVCGAVCPDRHCMRGCALAGFDRAIDIPAVQAAIIARARRLGVMLELARRPATGRRVAVAGGGPAGFGAAAVLAHEGVAVEVLEAGERPGGMARLIPEDRLLREVLLADLDFVIALGDVTVRTGAPVSDPASLLAAGYDAVVVASGLALPLRLGVPGEELAIAAASWLADPGAHDLAGRRVAVVGGGAVAADCAVLAAERGAAHVELVALEKLSEMPLTDRELHAVIAAGVHVSGRTRVLEVLIRGGAVAGLRVAKVALPDGAVFHPRAVKELAGSEQLRPDIDTVIVAIGAAAAVDREPPPGVFLAGDVEHGPTTVVEAVAAGKNAAAAVLRHLGLDLPSNDDPRPTTHVLPRIKSVVVLSGLRRHPVPLAAEFFGRPILSPFLLSASPVTDGYDQMRKAYEAGWAGGVMKTAFDNVPIHVPAAYMFSFGKTTFGNCDNVSEHPLDRVCGEIERLVREYPDRLTIGSSGGPVTGDDAQDAGVWQANTRKLEAAGAMGIEYSLSCPQGGDGTRGDIVAQDAELTARVIEWVLAAGDPEVPKLFKLTAAVTAIVPIIAAVRAAFARHPHARAGVTLANSFPALAFRRGAKAAWDEGIVVGLSGEGVTPISNLTLAKVAAQGVAVSGNGGPMSYLAAAHFLALGARTVQFCSAAMKYGVGVVDELHSGLSHLLAERGLASVGELIGRALPAPVTDFLALPAAKQVSALHPELCTRCGNCTRCPYLAITLGADGLPSTDESRCIGCTFCVQQCFAGALFMRDRA
jgi:NADPH-dependent glutamate synthase beta subunit-like oxidoreductase/dihydroorotate dehydrogenase/NAD-dependent dihydropyrimidine dehydrogenase PreA subunit